MKENQARSFFDETVVKAFLEAVSKTLEAYMGVETSVGEPMMRKDLVIAGDVAGVVNFQSHDVEGAMVIAFEKTRILDLYQNMLGVQTTEIDDEVKDCVGELANTIYGMAKAPLVDAGYEFPMSRPEVTLNVNSIFESAKSLALPLKVSGEDGLSMVLVVRRLLDRKQAA